MFETYVIENAKGKRYTGSTDCLSERLNMHNNEDEQRAKFHRTTYKKGPWKIIFSKKFQTRKEAFDYEKFLKTGKGRDWLKEWFKLA